MTVKVVIPENTIFDTIHTAAKYISWYAEMQRTTSGRLTAEHAKGFHTARAFLCQVLDEIDTTPERTAWYAKMAELSIGLNKLPKKNQPDWAPLRDALDVLSDTVSRSATGNDWCEMEDRANNLMSLCNYLDNAIRKQIDAAAAKHLAPLVALLH